MPRPSQATRAAKDVQKLLAKWISVSALYATAHQAEARRLRRRHTFLGAPSVVLSAIVGTSLFALMQEASQSLFIKAMLAAFSMVAAALSALVTFSAWLSGRLRTAMPGMRMRTSRAACNC